ncbi:synaptobrevin-domain-containing protein [Chaetomium fimeti]|uniref:Synaptobrevin-domain-containing protein n=1 Tax=Chaetomium fimeti TaxID=1854472 RepID=A0AAE0LUU4_9PEZI|nr:synaptobrevin-domain-containing protein [Chaetomium fimeti]
MASGAYDPFQPKGQGSQGAPDAPGGPNHGVNDIQRDIDDVIQVARENIMKVDDRGDRLTTLRDKSDGLQTEARHFNDRAGKVRRKMWWKDMKMRIWIGVGIIVLLAIIIIPAVVTTRGN